MSSRHSNDQLIKAYIREARESFLNAYYIRLQEHVLKSISTDVSVDGLDHDLKAELCNDFYYWTIRTGICSNDWNSQTMCCLYREPFTYLRKAQMRWEKKLYTSLNSMSNEMGVCLSSLRLASDKNEIDEKWNMLSLYSTDLSRYRPIYAPRDFQQVLFDIENSNYKESNRSLNFDFNHIAFNVPSLSNLKMKFGELLDENAILGLCSSAACDLMYSKEETRRIELGKLVLKRNTAPLAREYLKQLAPHCLRKKLWSIILGSQVTKQREKYYEELKSLVLRYDMMVDKLIMKDIQLTVRNDDQYFVFEDQLYQAMLCFSRDYDTFKHFYGSCANPIVTTLKGKSNAVKNVVIYPPNGIVPFHGFCMYAAPFCYVYANPVELYFTMRTFYTRYFCNLHRISSRGQDILALCVLFQRLLREFEPHLCCHFKKISVHPIKIVFKWITRCFSGHLSPEQLLYLWDLILAYDSLEIISLLAVAILSFRRNSLMEVETLPCVESVLSDLSSISVIPLLKFALL